MSKTFTPYNYNTKLFKLINLSNDNEDKLNKI